MAAREAVESPTSAPQRPAAAKDGASMLSPRFRSAAALARWDEESILLAALVVEDTPVRKLRHMRRPSASGGSAGSNRSGGHGGIRRARSRQWFSRSTMTRSQKMLQLDGKEEKVVIVEKKEASGSAEKAAATGKLPCMDRLREELSCAICLEICFEPSTMPCGHSFCMKCLKHAAAKCGKRCPKCRQLISDSRSCTINTVLWDTIQLLFPSEVEARRTLIASSSASNDDVNQSPPISNSFAQGVTRSRNTRRSFITQDNASSSNNNRNFITPGSRRSINTSSSFIAKACGTRTRDSSRGFVRASQLVTTWRSVGVRPI